MSAPQNIEDTINKKCNGIAQSFDRIAAGALGEKVVQDILIKSTIPLVENMQMKFDGLRQIGFGKFGKPFEKVNVIFDVIPSKTKGNVVRVGANGEGWEVVHFIEYGTVNRATKSGAYKGIMPSTRFMMVAVNEERSQVTLNVIESINKAINDNAKKEGLSK
jgi:hypothetical protein